jgi:phosphatidate cytidylyltransferase
MRDATLRERIRTPHALRDFGIRALTAVAIGTVLVVADLWGTMLVWAAAVALVAAACVIEFYGLMRTERRKPNEVFGVIAVAAMPVAAGLYATHLVAGSGASTSSELGAIGLTAVLGGLILAALLWHIVFPQVTASDTATTVFGALYVGFTLAHLVLLRALDSGAELVLITLAGVWAMDVIAYLVGSAIGRRPLAPRISPNKSWEGFAAGALATVLVWGLGWWLIRGASSAPSWWFLAIGAAAAVGGVLGDLAESRLKREVRAKDSGSLLPGHGGFLDRFDSLIFVSVVVYYMLLFGGAK